VAIEPEITLTTGRRMKVSVKFPKGIKFKMLTQKELTEGKRILVDDMKQTVPVDTGKLRNSIRSRLTPTGFEIYLNGKRNNEVAGYLIEGTKDHFIRPKGSTKYSKAGKLLKSPSKRKITSANRNKTILSWVQGGARYFSQGHMVSGIKKGYWRGTPRRQAITKFINRIRVFFKAK
jgi:hypothetical protein